MEQITELHACKRCGSRNGLFTIMANGRYNTVLCNDCVNEWNEKALSNENFRKIKRHETLRLFYVCSREWEWHTYALEEAMAILDTEKKLLQDAKNFVNKKR